MEERKGAISANILLELKKKRITIIALIFLVDMITIEVYYVGRREKAPY